MEKTHDSTGDDALAVVGMAGRFPGAGNLEAFWHNLADGVESITFFSDDEHRAAGLDAALLQDPAYVPARGMLEGIDRFDAAFFGYTPREAEQMDPQQRLFLEVAWEALEDAGYDPARYTGSVGVYAGVNMNTYLLNVLPSGRDFMPRMNDLHTWLASDKDYLTTRLSYHLNLNGPSFVIQCACATSLVAVCQAADALLNYQCDMALAGGVTVRVPQALGYRHEPGSIFSPDGHCRAFDADARGTVFGNGAGVVLLKRLADAQAAGDHIYAVVKGSAVNNDGGDKAGFTAPSVDGQARVVALAQAMAGVKPESISYIEAHGTGTEIGDVIEVEALTRVFRAQTDRTGFCALGTVKSNVGHLESASGITGFIKAVLALYHRQIPPTLHYRRPNPRIDFAASPFYVNACLIDWPSGVGPRRAGVSAFGIGGTNAHVVLEEAPAPVPAVPARGDQLLLLSAKSQPALEAATDNLVAYLIRHPEASLPDVAYTLQVGRAGFPYRRALVCRDVSGAIAALAARDHRQVASAVQHRTGRPVAFLLPGQGAQYAGMGAGLYAEEPLYRAAVDACAEQLRPHLGLDLRTLLYPPPEQAATAAEQLRQTHLTQPALFVTEYALAQLWMSWGLKPAALLGHSIGAYVAACLAGIFTLPDALAVVAARGRLMQALPRGSMLALALPPAAVLPMLDGELALAAVNGPSLCVVSGPDAAVDALAQRLDAQGHEGRRLQTSHAFHSAMMDPMLEAFAGVLAQVLLQPPQVPMVSNVTGTWITADEATDPAYWVRQARQTVRFADGVAALAEHAPYVLLEVGPGRTLSRLAAPLLPTDDRAAIASMRHPNEDQADRTTMLRALGRLWSAGVDVDWAAFYGAARRRRLPLPTYPFQRQRYWAEAPRRAPAPPPGKRPDVASWFYVPSWKRTAPPPPDTLPPQHWLLFADETGPGLALAAALWEAGHQVALAHPGPQFAVLADDQVHLDPACRADYDALLRHLQDVGCLPDRIVHLWSLAAPSDLYAAPAAEAALQRGFFSLMRLAQALNDLGHTAPLDVTVVTAGAYDVAGEAPPDPLQATVSGLVRAWPAEAAHVACRQVDVAATAPEQAVTAALLREVHAEAPPPVVAWRGAHRWVGGIEPARLAVPTPAAPLRERGVYLITGGLGGVGRTLALHLAATLQARLVLVGQKPLPPRTAWNHWLDGHAYDEATSLRIRTVQAMETHGADVLLHAADVADRDQVRALVDVVRQRFGTIHGVIHAAGRAGGGLLALRPLDAAAAVLAPKVQGTRALAEALQDQPLDFMLLCGSLLATTGAAGQADYSAANAFLDAFAPAFTAATGTPTLAVAWDTWQDVGMAADTEVPEQMRAARAEQLRLGMTPEEGLQVFRYAVQARLPHLIVSTQDLPARMAATPSAADAADPAPNADGATGYARPDLAASFVAPRTEAEQALADIWKALFGLEQVGIHDDFFELGGHSLLAAQMLNRINRQRPATSLSFRNIVDRPTIAGLAALLTGAAVAEAPVAEAPDGARAPVPSAPVAASQPVGAAAFGFSGAAPISSADKNPPVTLLLSAPRSGSTLLRLMLSAHPALFCPPELWLLGFDTMQAWHAHRAGWRQDGLADALAALQARPPEEAARQVDEMVAEDAAVQDVYRRLQALAAPRLLVDKTPGYAISPNTLRKAEAWFEAPRYIHLVRHPYAMIDSFARHRFHELSGDEGDPLAIGARYWALTNRNIQAIGRQVGSARYLVVRYEDLVQDPEAAMRRVCTFLEIPFHESVLDPYANGEMITGMGDPGILQHSGIEARLGTVWKDLHPPVPIDPEGRALAAVFDYPLRDDPAAAPVVLPEKAPPAPASLVAMQPHGDRPPLFLVPPAATPALCFIDLVKHFGQHQPCYAFEPLGLDGRATPHDALPDMAAHYIAEMKTVQPAGPYYLGGKCLGGVVAFEMAQQLRQQGEAVALVAILDVIRPPLLPAAAAAPRLQRLHGRLRDEGLRAMIGQRLQRWQHRARAPRGAPGGPQDQLSAQVHEAHRRARKHYTAAVYPGAITLIRVEMERDLPGYQAQWEALAEGGCRTYVVPGDHNTMIRPPHAAVLARQLMACMDETVPA